MTSPATILGSTLPPYIEDLANDPDTPAFVRLRAYRRERWTRGQVLAAARAAAAWLAAQGIGAGDRVLLQGANSPEWVAAFFGCVLRRAVVVPLDPGVAAEAAAALGQRVEVRAGFGDAPSAPIAGLPWTILGELEAADLRASAAPPDAAPDDLLEIIFTSGTTGTPRAVPITHANLLANFHHIEHGYLPRRRIVRVVHPRLLCLVPGSHLFGQVVGMLLPLRMRLPVVFLDDLRPRAIRAAIRTEKVMLGLAVPRLLRLVADDLVREGLTAAPAADTGLPPDAPHGIGAFVRAWVRKAWRARRVRRRLGWRFVGWVSGGARLEEEVEAFWERLGIVVVQGYGLTETAPVISINNPFTGRRGSVGRPLAGQQTRIGPGGELWVKGPNVTAGYLDDAATNAEVFADGWLRTGDRVDTDAEGRLYVRGRVKDVIVASDGTNIDPGEVEAALERQPGVREAACIAVPGRRSEEIHAVLVLETGRDAPPDAEAIVRAANAQLPAGRRVQSHSIWPTPALPRTHTGKLKRAAVREAVAAQAGSTTGSAPPPPAAATRDPIRLALAEMTGRSPEALGAGLDLDRDLGLSSLDRLDLLVRLEGVTGRTLDESTLAEAQTLGDLSEALSRPPAPPVPMPRWARSWPARLVRGLGRPTLIWPAFHALLLLRVRGREHLAALEPPFLLVANHESNLDTPSVLLALPTRLRGRLAVAMAADQFPAVFEPEKYGLGARLRNNLSYHLAALFFHGYPLPRGGAISTTLAYTGELADAGYCPLIYPEGRMRLREETGPLPFRAGVARVASELRLPIVPVGILGTGRALHASGKFPRPGRIEVRFGAPIRLPRAGALPDPAALTRQMEEAVLALTRPASTPQSRRVSGA